MRDRGRGDLRGSNGIISFIRREKPSLLEQRDWPPNRAPDVIQVKIWIGIFGLERIRRKICQIVFVVERPGSQRRGLIVVKRRAVIVRSAALRTDANVGNARIFRAEVGGQKINLTNRFERGLAGSGLTENAAIRPLPIKREARAVTLRSDEFERSIGSALRHVRIEVQERIHIAAVTW